MTIPARTIALAILSIPLNALAASPAYDVRTSATSVSVQNLTPNDYMELLLDVGGCGKHVMMGPGRAVKLSLSAPGQHVEVKAVKLTPMRQLRAKAGASLRPTPRPVTDPAVLAAMEPVCMELDKQ